MDKSTLGQFFTTDKQIQETLVSLCLNSGRVLEPSCGSGELIRAYLEKNPQGDIEGWEYDSRVVPVCDRALIHYSDFFLLSQGNHGEYDTIIGNPPFVAWKNVAEDTRTNASAVKSYYSDKTNLYHLFIHECVNLLRDGGELVFIVPKEWLYTTSATVLRRHLWDNGRITHLIDLGESKVFPDADVPALVIFRFVKTTQQDRSLLFKKNLSGSWENYTISPYEKNRIFLWSIGDLTSDNASDVVRVSDIFDIKVGIVSGADTIFRVRKPDLLASLAEEGTIREYETTRGIEHYIDVHDIDKEDDIPRNTHAYLLRHRNALMGRRIATFTPGNWWKYGAVRNRNMMDSSRERIYIPVKSRRTDAAFIGTPGTRFSGSLLGMFPHNDDYDIRELLTSVHSPEFFQSLYMMGMTTGNKYSLQPSTLGAVPLNIAKRTVGK